MFLFYILVDQTCEKHQTKNELGHNKPIQAILSDATNFIYTESSGKRPSLVQFLPAPKNGKIEVNTHILFPCNDSCGMSL